MLKIHKDKGTLTPLDALHLRPASSPEKLDLRGLVLASPDAFFSEIGHDLFVIGTNVSLSAQIPLSCDILALDRQGHAAVVVVAGEDEKSSLVRGITCAGLLSQWQQDDFLRKLPDDRVSALGRYLSVDTTAVNAQQRVLFVAQGFEQEDLTAVHWLKARGIDVLNVKVSRASTFHTDGEYLLCQAVSDATLPDPALMLAGGEGGWEIRIGANEQAEVSIRQEVEAAQQARQQAEQALRASEDRYWTLAKLSPVGIFHTDDQGSLLYVNDRWCEMAGLTPEEARGQGWARGLHSDDRDRVLSDWHDTTEQGLPFKAEFRFQRPDGGTSWVLGEAAVQKDEGGKVNGYVGTVTELHRVDATGASGPFAAGRR